MDEIENGMRIIDIKKGPEKEAGEATRDAKGKKEERKRKKMQTGQEERRKEEEPRGASQAREREQLVKKSGFGTACTDCGITTSNWCDGGTERGNNCVARFIIMDSSGNTQNSATCTTCDHRFGACRLCRGVAACTPPEWSGLDEPEREREAREKMMELKKQSHEESSRRIHESKNAAQDPAKKT